MTNRLPTVECCGCSERLGEHCPDDKCLKKCRGNYCVVDFDGIEQVSHCCRLFLNLEVRGKWISNLWRHVEIIFQGCGLGFPRLQSFLRMDNYLDYQGAPLCAR